MCVSEEGKDLLTAHWECFSRDPACQDEFSDLPRSRLHSYHRRHTNSQSVSGCGVDELILEEQKLMRYLLVQFARFGWKNASTSAGTEVKLGRFCN